jgi:DNA repair protein RAD5
VNIYVHYGQNRPKDASFIGQSDIVLTTYGVVSSEFSIDVSSEDLIACTYLSIYS